jgi:hypothetical protein
MVSWPNKPNLAIMPIAASTPEDHTFRSTLSGTTRSTGAIPVVPFTEPHWGAQRGNFCTPRVSQGKHAQISRGKQTPGGKKIGFWMNSKSRFLRARAPGFTRVESIKFGAYTPGVSNSVLVLPGGVGRAGASAKAAQGTPLWATLSTGPKKAPHVCYYSRAWGALNYQNMDFL